MIDLLSFKSTHIQKLKLGSVGLIPSPEIHKYSHNSLGPRLIITLIQDSSRSYGEYIKGFNPYWWDIGRGGAPSLGGSFGHWPDWGGNKAGIIGDSVHLHCPITPSSVQANISLWRAAILILVCQFYVHSTRTETGRWNIYFSFLWLIRFHFRYR